MSRFDLVSPRKAKDSDKTYFTKVGVAFANRSGDGYSLLFEALPLPDAEGSVRVLMMPAKPKDDRQGSRPAARDDEDSVPF
jgi:hypothetical protein